MVYSKGLRTLHPELPCLQGVSQTLAVKVSLKFYSTSRATEDLQIKDIRV